MKRILAKYPFIKPITLPADSYRGQSAPVAALGSWSLVLARPGLPDEAAYKLAPRPAQGRSRARREARAGEGIHARQHARRRAAGRT